MNCPAQHRLQRLAAPPLLCEARLASEGAIIHASLARVAAAVTPQPRKKPCEARPLGSTEAKYSIARKRIK